MSPALSPGFAGSPQSGVSRGGRPREWTDSRSRQLIRMYLYTGYRLEVLLEAVKDSTWAPHKDAAHKILHRALGNDPRWLRPKLTASPDHYIRHLEQSDRPIHRQPTLSAVDPLGISQHSTPVKVQASVALDYTEPSLNDLGWTSTSEPIYSAEAWQQPPQYTGAFALNGSAGSPMLHRRGSALSMTNTFMERLAFKGVSYSDAGNLWKVSRRFTMPKMGASSPQQAASSVRASPPGHHVFPGANISSVVDYSSAGYAVAGDLLNLGSRFSLEDRRACDKISRAHEDGKCWCTVSEVLFSQFQHLASARVVSVPDPYMIRHLHELDGTARDDFGHTSLHLLASSENCQSQLLSVVAEALNQDRELLGAVNTAGQTFLHLLHPSWFLPGSRLEDLVKILKQYGFSILGRDVYGRNLFHIMREYDTSFDRIQNCALGIDTKALNRRDAFGRMPLRSRPSIQAARSIRRLIAAQRLTIPASGSPPATESESRILAQTKLLKIIYDAVSTEPGEGDPTREDLEGRNGFHALAEVILSMKSIKKHANIGVKRKHDKASTDDTVNEEPVRRIELMEGLIGARVDVNHHNIAGDTPLMTFVVRLSDGETKAENLEVRNIIDRLVEAGADMERRNRRGETALAIAARHGQKVAVDALLKLGANPYVRNSDGASILGVVDSMWRVSTGDSTGSYEACRKLLCGRPPMIVEPKQCPSIIDEWSFRQQRAVA